MNEPAHVRYQKQLAALADDATIVERTEDAACGRTWWLPQRNWVRRCGRFEPDCNPFATLVFEAEGKPQTLIYVEVFQTRPPERDVEEALAFDASLGWLRVTPFPSDRKLSTLASVLAGKSDATIVRYRPRRRCTIRFGENGRTLFAKVYPKKFLRYGRGENFHSTAVALWEAASREELGFAVAQPGRWDSQTRVLWQSKLDGTPAVAQLFGSGGDNMARRMGLAAASLTRSCIKPYNVFDRTRQLSSSLRCGEELVHRIPRLASAVGELLKRLGDMNGIAESRPLRPIHGDMDANQWLDDGVRLGLTDFDDFSLGDPELDAATFLAELEVEDQPQLPFDQLAEAFLEGYESVGGPLDHSLLSAYLAHKRLFKALRSARALRQDGDVQAERHLVRAQHCISKMNAQVGCWREATVSR